MNNYKELKNYLDAFTDDLNDVMISITGKRRKNLLEYGKGCLTELVEVFNESNTLIKIKDIVVNETALILFARKFGIIYSLAAQQNKMEIFEQYRSDVYQLFLNYVSDNRFYNADELRRGIAINGSADITYYEGVTNLFCNTATLLGFKYTRYNDIKNNESEGTEYIIDHLQNNYSSLHQSRYALISIRFD